MKSRVAKRSIVINKHKTSVSLEEEFWLGLKEIARSKSIALTDEVSAIDDARKDGNLSSAIRLYVLHHYRDQLLRRGEVQPEKASALIRMGGIESA
jgi:predicted DNA-binding ribbon-helix-helix protein